MSERTILIVYHERLGDVARCLPIAKWYADQGHSVFFECKPEYHGLFAMVDYVQPILPLSISHDQFDTVHDLQIWHRRFADFEASGLNWMDYIYADFPQIDREIILNKAPKVAVPPEVKNTVLVFPNGYSQRNAPDPQWVWRTACELFPTSQKTVIGKADLGCHELPSIAHLVAWIKEAKAILTVNTAPSILASAVRDTWHHIPDLDPRHDWQHPRAVRVERNVEARDAANKSH